MIDEDVEAQRLTLHWSEIPVQAAISSVLARSTLNIRRSGNVFVLSRSKWLGRKPVSQAKNRSHKGKSRKHEPISRNQDEAGLKLREGYNPSLKSIDFRDSDLRDVIRTLAGIGNINIVLDPHINGAVTVMFHDVQVQDALNALFDVYNLKWAWRGKVLVISPAPETFRVENTYHMRNRKVGELVNTMYELITPGVGTFSVNVASNTIAVGDYAPIVRAAGVALKVLDLDAGSISPPIHAETQFVTGDGKYVSIGSDALRIDVIGPQTGSYTPAAFGIFQGKYGPPQFEHVASFSYDAIEVGSGTEHPVQVDCQVYVTVYDATTWRPLKLRSR